MPSRPSILISKEQHERCCEAVRAGLGRSLKVREPLTASQWADKYFYLSPESSGQEGPWETLPYQVAVLDLMGADEPRTVTFRKSARIGYTKMLVAGTAYRLEHKRRNGAHFQPTDGDAKEMCKTEFDPMIRDCPVMAEMSDASENRKRDDTLSMKKLGKKVLYIRGGNAPARFRRITADFVDYDELDGFEREIGTEGDPLSLGDRAITNSSFPKSFRGSTPGNSHDSLIQQEVDEASLLFEYYVECPECGEKQPLAWSQMRWDGKDAKDGSTLTIEERAESVKHHCRACDDAWDYRDIWLLLETGQWRSEDGHAIATGEADPVLLDPDGMITEWPRHIAMYLWAAYSVFFSWSELVTEWLKAQGNILKLKTFTNHRLGQVWEDEAEQVDENELFERREHYGVPEDVLVVLASIDIQETWIEILVSGYSKTEESWYLEHVTFEGMTDKITETVYSDASDFLKESRYIRNDGVELRINAVAVDTGFNTDAAYLFCSKLKMRRVYAVKGKAGDRAVVTLPPSKQQTLEGSELLLHTVGVDNAKRLIVSRLGKKSTSRINLNLEVTQEQCEQLTAEKLVTKYQRGFAKKEWVKTRDRNEMLDLYVYQLAALYILKPNYAAIEKRLAKQIGQAPAAKKQPVDQAEEVQKRERRERQARRKSKNRVTKW